MMLGHFDFWRGSCYLQGNRISRMSHAPWVENWMSRFVIKFIIQ